jgi:hypothetical protein
MEPGDSVRSLHVVDSSNLKAEEIFSQLHISGCCPPGDEAFGAGAASKKDFSR